MTHTHALVRRLAFTMLAAGAPLAAQQALPVVAGFQRSQFLDAAGDTIALGIWYPTHGAESLERLGLAEQRVVANGPIDGSRLPLVVISHGTGGSMSSHIDLALALARAGFIVAALTHPHDNTSDGSSAGMVTDLADRPRHVSETLDYLLGRWNGQAHVDAARIGMFGFSLGGFTTLVLAGATPELGLLRARCERVADAPECTFVAANHGNQLDSAAAAHAQWTHDSRVRAAVVAAPAIAFTLAETLDRVRVPVQLWRAADDRDSPNSVNADLVEQKLGSRPEVHTITRAGHLVFLAPCSAALARVAVQICTDAPGVDRVLVHRDLSRSVVAFFRHALAPPDGQPPRGGRF